VSLKQTALLQIVLAAMPTNRIQPRTWFVKLQLTPRDSPSDANVGSCIKNILDLSNNFRLIRGLQHVSFSYSVRDPMQDTDLAGTQVHSNMMDVVGFAHSNESILDMHSWIQDSHVMDQRWTPVYVTPGQSSNWMQTDIIKNFLDQLVGGDFLTCSTRNDLKPSLVAGILPSGRGASSKRIRTRG
jgi:hypothetical protein